MNFLSLRLHMGMIRGKNATTPGPEALLMVRARCRPILHVGSRAIISRGRLEQGQERKQGEREVDRHSREHKDMEKYMYSMHIEAHYMIQ